MEALISFRTLAVSAAVLLSRHRHRHRHPHRRLLPEHNKNIRKSFWQLSKSIPYWVTLCPTESYHPIELTCDEIHNPPLLVKRLMDNLGGCVSTDLYNVATARSASCTVPSGSDRDREPVMNCNRFKSANCRSSRVPNVSKSGSLQTNGRYWFVFSSSLSFNMALTLVIQHSVVSAKLRGKPCKASGNAGIDSSKIDQWVLCGEWQMQSVASFVLLATCVPNRHRLTTLAHPS
jgi:hypothetical protein